MKHKIALFVAKVIWWMITNKWFTHKDRTKILTYMLNEHLPGKHIHSTPKRKVANG